MATFLCAVHARDHVPAAFALVEQMPGADGPAYTVRALRALSGDDPTADLIAEMASEEQYAGNVRVVTTGGQPAADALHARGPSAMAVSLRHAPDASSVSLQVLVDTFEMLYRAGVVDVPGSLDAASGAVDAMYTAADLDNAAPGGDRADDGDLLPGAEGTPDDGPTPATIEQSGNEAADSTATIEAPVRAAEASAAAVEAQTTTARIAAETGAEAPDLGDDADTATALALAVWFGEASRDGVLDTDKADEASKERLDSKPPRG